MDRFHRRQLQRVCAALALFAILLVALMPTIARAVAAAKGESLMIQELCSAQGGKRLVLNVELDDALHGSATHLEKCGYCALLTQQPIASNPNAATYAPLPKATQELPARFYNAAPKLHAWRTAQPRAPPL
jgi:hypothetical protein